MTYIELVTAIKNYVENDFTTDEINTIIKQAEQRLYNTVQLPELRKTTTGATVIGTLYIDCPTDFLAPHSFAVVDATGNYQFMLDKDVNYLREAYPSATTSGLPRYYAIFGNKAGSETQLTFMVTPTPDAAYNYELQYFYYPTSIVTASTTWLGNEFDSALLYGCIVEAYAFLKGAAEIMQVYMTRYTEAVALLKQLGDGKLRRDSYRSGQVRFPVQ